MDIFKKNLAPITQEAWAEIEEQARDTLNVNLSARSIVDFDGPHGMQKSSINLGHVEFGPSGVIKGVEFGSRKVLPLIEVRVPFSLSMEELDHISRGFKTPDLDPVEEAARKAAHFEEKAIFRGFAKGNIDGIFPSSEHKPLKMKKSGQNYQEIVENAVVELQNDDIDGPYQLILGTKPYQSVMQGDEKGYPLRKRLEGILGGSIHWSPALEGGVVLSGRGGDFVFTVGQDFSIGYAGHDAKKVNLYFTESFTFQALEPRAAIELQMQK